MIYLLKYACMCPVSPDALKGISKMDKCAEGTLGQKVTWAI